LSKLNLSLRQGFYSRENSGLRAGNYQMPTLTLAAYVRETKLSKSD
jgi:hypothetical protein